MNITTALIQTGLAAKGCMSVFDWVCVPLRSRMCTDRHVNVDEGWLLGRNATTGEIISDPVWSLCLCSNLLSEFN
jgi:hypothetical protein